MFRHTVVIKHEPFSSETTVDIHCDPGQQVQAIGAHVADEDAEDGTPGRPHLAHRVGVREHAEPHAGLEDEEVGSRAAQLVLVSVLLEVHRLHRHQRAERVARFFLGSLLLHFAIYFDR